MTTPKLITKDTSVDQVEELYTAFGDGHPLEIPNGFKTLRIGLVSRLSQFFITQEKRHHAPLHFSWVNPDNDENKSNIIEDPICLTALLMADDIIGENSKNIKRKLSSNLVERFETPVFRKGRQIQMFAIDHSIEKYARPECFYSSSENSKSPQTASYYFDIIQTYFKQVGRHAKLRIRDFIGIGELLAELIDNTDQHAKSDYSKGKSQRSVRAVILNSHLITKDRDGVNICGKDNPVASYISSFRPNNETLNLLEISVFDSGPGIYRSFPDHLQNPSIEEESSKVLSCFMNGITSKPNGIGVGRGLDKARKILDLRQGFLSIRTGRLAMYRDFKHTPIADEMDADRPDIELFDESTNQRNSFSTMKDVEGVSYTILVPLQ